MTAWHRKFCSSFTQPLFTDHTDRNAESHNKTTIPCEWHPEFLPNIVPETRPHLLNFHPVAPSEQSHYGDELAPGLEGAAAAAMAHSAHLVRSFLKPPLSPLSCLFRLLFLKWEAQFTPKTSVFVLSDDYYILLFHELFCPTFCYCMFTVYRFLLRRAKGNPNHLLPCQAKGRCLAFSGSSSCL